MDTTYERYNLLRAKPGFSATRRRGQVDTQPSIDTGAAAVADPLITRLAELRRGWQGSGGGFLTTPEGSVSV